MAKPLQLSCSGRKGFAIKTMFSRNFVQLNHPFGKADVIEIIHDMPPYIAISGFFTGAGETVVAVNVFSSAGCFPLRNSTASEDWAAAVKISLRSSFKALSQLAI